LKKLLELGEQGTFDFAFIDADKENYLAYYEACLQLLRPGGLICIDNVLWSGQVLETDSADQDTRSIQELNQYLHGDDRVDLVMLAVADGITLALKK
jgi:caffeoyl-CoA O-methyltransferase